MTYFVIVKDNLLLCEDEKKKRFFSIIDSDKVKLYRTLKRAQYRLKSFPGGEIKEVYLKIVDVENGIDLLADEKVPKEVVDRFNDLVRKK